MAGTLESAHEFGALNTLLLVVILGLCILAAYLIKQNQFYYLPESAAAIMVGLFVGGLARMVYPSAEELQFLTFEPELFFFLLMPPIIFEAGYSLKKRDFFANFWTISLFAVFGTIVSTFVIGYCVYSLGVLGLVKIDASSPMEALIYGALLSSVDPVATLSIMGNPELNCDPLLYSLVFGESVLNDAVAIVLFKTFSNFYESGEVFSSSTIPSIMMNFSGVSVGGIFVGLVIGLTCAYLCKHTQLRRYPEYEVSILFLFAYGSYAFSEALQLSGIFSLFVCGLVLSHYNSYNLSPTSQVTAHYIFKTLAVLSEFFVFLYIGMGIFTGRYRRWNFFFFFVSMLFCLVSRFFNVFPLTFVANLMRHKIINRKMQVVMWFAGLRGAISFALSQNMPGENKDLYISTTLSIVIFTTVVCGGLTEPMMKRMGMRLDKQVGSSVETMQYERLHESEDAADHAHIESPLAISSASGDQQDLRIGLSPPQQAQVQAQSKLQMFFHKFDKDFMRPIFGGPSENADENADDTDFHPTPSIDPILASFVESRHSDSLESGSAGMSVPGSKAASLALSVMYSQGVGVRPDQGVSCCGGGAKQGAGDMGIASSAQVLLIGNSHGADVESTTQRRAISRKADES